ncbi:MAG: PD40 domain-containing protein, partial [Chloroflexi bacterium]|nr:PD40 domain-containing protein [Chloroflexota bacterium]
MSENSSPRPRSSSWRYGSVALNILTLCCCVSTVWLGGYYALLLVNPYSLNPFPPPSDPTQIVIATITPTSIFDFPSFTPSLAPTSTGTPTLPPATSTRGVTLASVSPSPAASSLPLQTATITRTGSVVPSPTRQGGATSSITSTPVGGATATKGTAAPTSAPNTSISGRMLFISNRNGADGIFLASGTTIQTVVSDGFKNQKAMLSPDGKKVLYASNKDGDDEIYTVDLDGGNAKALTANTKSDVEAVWSPDGKQIAYATNTSGTYDVWIMNADGTG